MNPTDPAGTDVPSSPAEATSGGVEVASVTATTHRRRVARALLASAAARLGLLLLTGFVVVALTAPILAPCPTSQLRRCGDDPYVVPRYGFSSQPHAPDRSFPFGTTPKQYDIFYGVVWGTRTAFKVGLLITLPALLFGMLIGSLAGFYGGWIDEI